MLRASHPEEVREVVEAAAGQAYNACTPTAVLLSQRLIGAKVFVEMSKANLLDRRSVVSSLLAERKDAIVVGGLGASTYDIAAAGDHDRNFYLWGAMGGAVMIGLGLALAQPKLPVVVITGDGEMLMGMGSLATVGLQKPGQPHRSWCWTTRSMARPAGRRAIPRPRSTSSASRVLAGSRTARAMATMAEIEAFAPGMQDVASGPRFASVKIDSANLERVLSSRDGTFIVNRIRGSLGFQPDLDADHRMHRSNSLTFR